MSEASVGLSSGSILLHVSGSTKWAVPVWLDFYYALSSVWALEYGLGDIKRVSNS